MRLDIDQMSSIRVYEYVFSQYFVLKKNMYFVYIINL